MIGVPCFQRSWHTFSPTNSQPTRIDSPLAIAGIQDETLILLPTLETPQNTISIN
jgi:hypothetical protein